MNLEPELAIQLIMGGLLGVIGLMVRLVLERLERLESQQAANSSRLVRIETKLNLS